MTISSNDKTVIKSISPFQTLGNTIIWTQVRQKSVSGKDWENVLWQYSGQLIRRRKIFQSALIKKVSQSRKIAYPSH